MVNKYFKFDKNYILEAAQLDNEERLVVYMINFVKAYYQVNYNPLGLEDDTMTRINKHQTVYTERLSEFYRNLCGVYRYKFGDNQLEFLFDGTDHYEKYVKDWKADFKQWLEAFCAKPNFIKAVLELTVFFPEDRKAFLVENRMKAFIEQHFQLKLYKYRGITEMKVA
ncbi:MAG: hypothetical protein R3345_09670 [Fulvivirga sp.]|nr:hypothetical protein [Fulvivirga sp.]